MVCEHSDVFASACAIARAFPIFSRRSSSSRRTEKKHVSVEFVIVGQDSSALDVAELEVPTCFLPLKLFGISNQIDCKDLLNASQLKACFLFSVSPTLQMESAWQLASWTRHAMR